VLRLVLFVVPLGLDTFAVSAALGIAGLPKEQRLKVSLLMSGFETAMPLVGVLVGHGLAQAIGGTADYLAATFLIGLGAFMLVARDEREAGTVSALVGNRGLALAGLGIGISLDELAMGFSIGLLHLSLPAAVILIGAQAFLLAQLGLRLGARLGEAARERVETLAALALLGLGVLVLVEQLAS
jgi:manganese efflux pump family protein